MNLDHLLDGEKGIYANTRVGRPEAERPASMELIHPDGKKGFQIDCGIRIRGGFSRRSSNPKHSFLTCFRGHLRPVQAEIPALRRVAGRRGFDNVDLRTFGNYSWHIGDKERTDLFA